MTYRPCSRAEGCQHSPAQRCLHLSRHLITWAKKFWFCLLSSFFSHSVLNWSAKYLGYIFQILPRSESTPPLHGGHPALSHHLLFPRLKQGGPSWVVLILSFPSPTSGYYQHTIRIILSEWMLNQVTSLLQKHQRHLVLNKGQHSYYDLKAPL